MSVSRGRLVSYEMKSSEIQLEASESGRWLSRYWIVYPGGRKCIER